MKLAKGPRPWTIWLFAALSTALVISNLVQQLLEPLVALSRYGWLAPGYDWDEDSLIVASSAAFTINMIPIVLIWAFAVRFARWLVLAMALIPAPIHILALLHHISKMRANGWGEDIVMSHMIFVGQGFAIQFGLIALLFLPPSNRWFARRGEVETHAFE